MDCTYMELVNRIDPAEDQSRAQVKYKNFHGECVLSGYRKFVVVKVGGGVLCDFYKPWLRAESELENHALNITWVGPATLDLTLGLFVPSLGYIAPTALWTRAVSS